MTLEDFSRTYQRIADEALSFWTPEMQREVALHNPGWAEGSAEVAEYLRRSVIRLSHRVRRDRPVRPAAVCDSVASGACGPSCSAGSACRASR